MRIIYEAETPSLLYRKLRPIKQKTLRGMRTSHIRKMSADADPLRRESPVNRTLCFCKKKNGLRGVRNLLYD